MSKCFLFTYHNFGSYSWRAKLLIFYDLLTMTVKCVPFVSNVTLFYAFMILAFVGRKFLLEILTFVFESKRTEEK